MPQQTRPQLTNAKSTNRKAGKAGSDNILDDTPLFAGLDDYILKQKVRMHENMAKKEREEEKTEKTTQRTKRTTSGKLLPLTTPTVQKTAAIDTGAILLSVTEICALLKISRATLIRMDKSGQLPGRIKLGGSVRFHRETVETWLQSLISSRATI